MFTEHEIAYLTSQRLGRIATVSASGQPDVVPVGVEFDGQHLYVGGHDLTATRKYKNVVAGNHRVALVVDDLASVSPWRPRGIRIYGTADVVQRRGMLGEGEYLRIAPAVSWSWGVEPTATPQARAAHKTIHRPPKSLS